MIMRGCEYIKEKADLPEYEVYILDIDGTLMLGTTQLPKSAAGISQLVHNGKKLYFLTNNSWPTRKQIVDKLVKAGFPEVPLDSVYGTAAATAAYLRQIDFTGTVFLIGGQSLQSELSALPNVTVRTSQHFRSDVAKQYATPFDLENAIALDEQSISAVVIGFDMNCDYVTMSIAHRILTRNMNCLFISTNKDVIVPVNTSAGKSSYPGTGTIVMALERTTGRESVVVGKPSTYILEDILYKTKAERKNVCLIGDNINTDIKCANRGNIVSILVETGVHKYKDAEESRLHDKDCEPIYVIPSFGEMFS